jgi:hypothetical protein
MAANDAALKIQNRKNATLLWLLVLEKRKKTLATNVAMSVGRMQDDWATLGELRIY